MMQYIKMLADELCDGRLVLTLEGGYDFSSLAASVGVTFDVMLGNNEITDHLGQKPYKTKAPDITDIISKVKEVHHLS